ncbi:transthyretin [Ranitomeya imitator]|uniref:transthyretin n=1 Tax=Ranitomeya imitator TaxID=111125 RepID=UPI0037E83E6F
MDPIAALTVQLRQLSLEVADLHMVVLQNPNTSGVRLSSPQKTIVEPKITLPDRFSGGMTSLLCSGRPVNCTSGYVQFSQSPSWFTLISEKMTCFKVLAVLTAALVFCDTVKWVRGAQDDTYSKCALMIKVLDAVRGIPAAKLSVKVHRQKEDKSWDLLSTRVTSEEGEIHNLVSEENFVEGVYKLELATKRFWSKVGLSPFHEYVDVVFTANDAGHRHYTIAVLLTPYSFSTTAVVSEQLQNHT